MTVSRVVGRCLCCIYLLIACGWGSAQTTVRIVASNVTSGNFQSYQTAGINILKALAPDVCLMQEFNVHTVSGGANDTAAVNSFVSANFGAGFSWYRESEVSDSIPNGIVSRYPILASGEWTDTSGGGTNRDFAYARIDIPGPIDLYAISVHLWGNGGSSGRNAEAQAIMNTYIPSLGIPANAYVVIGGDLNTDNRSESCIATFSSGFVTGSPYPIGQDGDPDTNLGRTSPYDWVIPNSNLNAIKTTTTYGSFSYTNGLVFDTRDFTQAQLDGSFSPTQVANSGDTQMQHMAVVRTFVIPSSTPTSNGDTVTISSTDRAPATAQIGNSAPMLSVSVTAATNEWDVGTIRFNRLGTTPDATVAAKVYLDANNNGVVDAGETQIGSGSFVAGTTNITLSPSPRATPGSPARLLGVLSVLNTATSGSTMQLQLAANGITHASSGGADSDPTYSASSSGVTTIVSAPAVPVVSGSSVVLNKYFKGATASAQAVELLVVQDHLDMRNMILKDFSASMANDNGGKYTFSTASLWSDVRAGTLIVLRNGGSSTDTNASDYKLDISLTDSSYFGPVVLAFDISGAELVMIKSAGSGTSGVAGNIHTLAGGTAGAQYTAINTGAKLRATATVATGEYVIVDNQWTTNTSLLSNFSDGGGFAYGAVTTATLGSANGPANQNFITFLRGPSPLPADQVTGNGFQANWNALVTAVNYRLDVATDAAFNSPVPGYNNVEVSGTSATVGGLSGSSTYYYRVRGVNAEGTPSGSGASMSVTTTAGVPDWSLYGN
ncbi:MAG: endonuclease/exonuclease/phosphatase family protein [Candidatus Sumerlaeaceae bacterium]